MFVVHETSPDFRFSSLISRKLHLELKQLTEVLKLYGFATSYVERILALKCCGKQVTLQERYDFEVSN